MAGWHPLEIRVRPAGGPDSDDAASVSLGRGAKEVHLNTVPTGPQLEAWLTTLADALGRAAAHPDATTYSPTPTPIIRDGGQQ